MNMLWRDCDVQIGFKISIMDAVSRAGLFDGMDSVQLTPTNQRRLEVFQSKGLKKSYTMTSTYV